MSGAACLTVRPTMIQQFQEGALIPGTRQKAVLNSSDRLYEELRDQSFAAVGPRLGEKAKAIQVNYQVRWAARSWRHRRCQSCAGRHVLCSDNRAAESYMQHPPAHIPRTVPQLGRGCLLVTLAGIPQQRAQHLGKAGVQGSKATDRTMAELKEFAGELKALPNISRHISLAEELSRRIARPGFRDRVTVEQALLDGHSLDSTAETLEV